MSERITDSINIEEIMNEIREEASKLPMDMIPDFDDISNDSIEPIVDSIQSPVTQSEMITQLGNEAVYLRTTAYNPYYTDMGGGLKGLIKRIIRKANKPLILPMSDRQNDFNLHVANVANEVHQLGIQQMQQLNMTNEQMQQYKDQIDYLTAKVDELSRAVTIYRWRLFDHLGIKAEENDEK